MKKTIAGLGASALLALAALVGLAPAAHAYPEVVIDLSVDHQVRYGGEKFTATATANVSCDWTLEWNGDARSKGSSSRFVTTYTAPDVSRTTKIPLHGTCDYLLPDGATPVTGRLAAGRATAQQPVTWKRTIMITVLPRGDVAPPSQSLPNTGGPSRWLLVAGAGLLLAGAGTLARSKRDVKSA